MPIWSAWRPPKSCARLRPSWRRCQTTCRDGSPGTAGSCDLALSLVLLQREDVAGAMLCWRRGETIEVDVNVVAPRLRRGWTNLPLLEGTARPRRRRDPVPLLLRGARARHPEPGAPLRRKRAAAAASSCAADGAARMSFAGLLSAHPGNSSAPPGFPRVERNGWPKARVTRPGPRGDIDCAGVLSASRRRRAAHQLARAKLPQRDQSGAPGLSIARHSSRLR